MRKSKANYRKILPSLNQHWKIQLHNDVKFKTCCLILFIFRCNALNGLKIQLFVEHMHSHNIEYSLRIIEHRNKKFECGILLYEKYLSPLMNIDRFAIATSTVVDMKKIYASATNK